MTRKVNRTARIKPATRDALKDQFALAADHIIAERLLRRHYARMWREQLSIVHHLKADLADARRRWWHPLVAWWRA